MSSITFNYNFPNFVSLTRGTFVCKCKVCADTEARSTKFIKLAEIEEHLKTLHIPFFNCPVPSCNHRVARHARTISNHIQECHPRIDQDLHLFCEKCNDYTAILHLHCTECKAEGRDSKFLTKEELEYHLKKDHVKWWLEKPCRFGTNCKDFKNGICGFNHLLHQKTYITPDAPDKICRYEQPWLRIRCNRSKCSYDHLWGRVRHVLEVEAKAKARTRVSTETTATTPDAGGGGPDAGGATSDLPDMEFNISSIQIDDTVGVEVDSDLSDEHLDKNTDDEGEKSDEDDV